MQFNVSSLLREPTGSSRRFGLDPEGDLLEGRLELIRTPGGLLARFEGRVESNAACSRCLRPMRVQTPVRFEEVYAQQVDLITGRRLPPPEDPDSFLVSTDNVIDITEAVRQYSETAAELRPLCRADCPGLCPVCGTDLSTTVCSCDRNPADPRWAALEALRGTRG
jgi:uncharacterized protein